MANKFQWPGGYSGQAFDPMALRPQDVFWFLDLETNWIPEQKGPGWREGQVPFSFSLQPFGIRGGKWTNLGGGITRKFNVAGAGHDPAALLSEVSDPGGIEQTLSTFLGDAKPAHFSGKGTWNYATFAKHLEENVLSSGGRIVLGGQNLAYDIPIIDQILRDAGIAPILSRTNVYMADTVTLSQKLKNQTGVGHKLPQLVARHGQLMPDSITGREHEPAYDALSSGYVWGGMTQKLANQQGITIPGINAPFDPQGTTPSPNLLYEQGVSYDPAQGVFRGGQTMAQQGIAEGTREAVQYHQRQSGIRSTLTARARALETQDNSLGFALLGEKGVAGLLGQEQTLFGSAYLKQDPSLGHTFRGNEWRVDTETVGESTRVNILRQLRGGRTQSLTFDVQAGPQTEFGQSFQVMTPSGAGYYIGSSIHYGVEKGQKFGEFGGQLSRRTPVQNLAQLIMGSFYLSDINRTAHQGFTVEQAMGEIIQSGLRVPGSGADANQWLIKAGALMGSPNEYETTLNRFAAQMPLYLQSTKIGENLPFTIRRDANARLQEMIHGASPQQVVHGGERVVSGVAGALQAGGYYLGEEGRFEKGAEATRYTAGGIPEYFMMREPGKYIGKESVYGRRLPVRPVAYDEQTRQFGFAEPDAFKTRADRSPIYGRMNALYPGEKEATNAFYATTLYAETGIPGGGISFGNRYSPFYSFGVERTKAKMFSEDQLTLDMVMRGGAGIQFDERRFGKEISGGVGRATIGWMTSKEGPLYDDPSSMQIDVGESSFIPKSGEMVIPRYARRTSSGAWQPVRARGAGLSGDESIIDMTEYEAMLSERMGVPVKASGITQVGWNLTGIQETATKWGGSGVKAGMTLSTKDRFLAGSRSGGIDYMTGEMKQPAMRMWDSFAAMSTRQQTGMLEEWSTRLAGSQGKGDPRAFMTAVRAEYPWNARDAANPITGERTPPIMDPTRLAQMGTEAGILGKGAIGWEIFGSMFGTMFGQAPKTSTEWTQQTEYLRKFGVGWRDVGNVPLPEHSASSLNFLMQTFEKEYAALGAEGALAQPAPTWRQAFKNAFDIQLKDPVGRATRGQPELFNVSRRNVTGLQMAGTAPWEAEYAGGMRLNFEAQYALSAKYPDIAREVGAHVGFTDKVSQAWGEMFKWTSYQAGAQSGDAYAIPKSGEYIPISSAQIENIQTKMMRIDRTLQDPEKVSQLQKTIAQELGIDPEDRRMLYAKGLHTFIPSAMSALDLEYEEHNVAIGRQSTMLWNAWKMMGNAATDVGRLPAGFPQEDIEISQRQSAQKAVGTMFKYYSKTFGAGEEAMKRVTGQRNLGLGGIGGRFAALPSLEINEVYLPNIEINRLLGSAGIPKEEWGEAKDILNKEGFVPSVMWRYPQLSVDAGYRGMKLLSEEQMARQGKTFPVDPRTLRGKLMPGDPAARNVAFVSPWFAELMSGDFDYDPYAMLALIRRGGDRPLEIIKDPQVQAEIEQSHMGILKDTDRYLKAMFPDPRIRRKTSALRDSMKNVMGETGLLADIDTGVIGSPDQIIKAYETFGYNEKHFNELAVASEEYSLNKMGMGRSYNMRRMIEAAGAVEGRGNVALRQAWEQAAQHYQPHLDLYFGASAGLESAASAYFRMSKPDVGRNIEKTVADISFYHREQKFSIGLKDFQSKAGMKMIAESVLRPEQMFKEGSEVDPTGNVLFSYLFSRDDAEMLRINKLMENVKGADRAQVYMDYLDTQPDNDGTLFDTPIVRGMVAGALRKKTGDERTMAETYISNLRGEDYLKRILATETVYNISAASKSGATPAVRYGQTLEVLRDQPGLNLYGTLATSVIERGVGGKQTMVAAPPGGGGIIPPKVTAAGFPNPFDPNDFMNELKRVTNAIQANQASTGYKAPISAEMGNRLYQQAGSLGAFTQTVTGQYEMLPGMLEGAYGGVGFGDMGPQEAINRFVAGMTEGGTPEFDLKQLVGRNPELAGVLKKLGARTKLARRSLRREVVEFAGSKPEQDVFRQMLLPLAGYESTSADPMQMQAVAGMQGLVGAIPASEFSRAMPKLSPTNTLREEAAASADMYAAELMELSTQRPGRTSYAGKAHRQRMGLAGARLQHAEQQKMRLRTQSEIASTLGVEASQIPMSGAAVRDMADDMGVGLDQNKIDQFQTRLSREMKTYAGIETKEAGLEPIGVKATANLREVSKAIAEVSEATKSHTKVLNDHKSSINDVAKSREDLMVREANLATEGRKAGIGTALDLQTGRLSRRAVTAAARTRIGQLSAMDELTDEQTSELQGLEQGVLGMDKDEANLAQARRAQRAAAVKRRPWARAGGFARRLFGGFGMMYLGTVSRLAWSGARLGYEESVESEMATAGAIGAAIGGVPIDSIESKYQTAMGLYGGFGQRGLKTLQTNLATEQPGLYSTIMGGVGALGAAGASMWIMGLAGVTGPAAPAVGAAVAIGSFGLTQYANYQGAMADPQQVGVTGASRGYQDQIAWTGDPAGNPAAEIVQRVKRNALELGGISAWFMSGADENLMAWYQSTEAQKTTSILKKLESYEASAEQGKQTIDQRAFLSSQGVTDRGEQGKYIAAYARYKGTKFSGIPEAGRLAASAFTARYGVPLSDPQFGQLATMAAQNVPIVETAGAMALVSGGGGGTVDARVGGLVQNMLSRGYDTADITGAGRGAQFFESLGPWATMQFKSSGELLDAYREFNEMTPRGKAMFAQDLGLAEGRALLGYDFVEPDPSRYLGAMPDYKYQTSLQNAIREQRSIEAATTIQQQMVGAELPQEYINNYMKSIEGRSVAENVNEAQRRLAASSFVANLQTSFMNVSGGQAGYLGRRFQGGDWDLLSMAQWGTAARAAGGDFSAMGQLWGMQSSGQIPTNIGMDMTQMGYMMRNDIYQAGEMRGIVSSQPLFTNTMNWGGFNAEGVANLMWGDDWATGGPTMPATPGGAYMSTRQAMVRQIPLEGQQDIFGDQMMLGGRNAMQYMQSNLQLESALASASLALQGIALQQAFQTGVGLESYAGTVNPQTGRPFGISTGKFGWSVPGVGSGQSTGGGLWGVQDALRGLNYAQQGYAFDRQFEQLGMTSEFFYQNMDLQQEQATMQRQWAKTSWGFQDQSRAMTKGFAREEWAFQDQNRALTWAWKQEDFAESSRFLTGRDRRLAERQMQRETIMYGVEGEQIDKQREQQKEIWALEDAQIQKQRENQVELWALEDKRFSTQISQHEEQRKFQEESIETNRRFFEERKKLEEEMQKLQRAFQVEQWELAKKQAATSAYYAQKSKEAQDAMLEIALYQADIIKLQDAAIAGNRDALAKLAEYWEVSIQAAAKAIGVILSMDLAGGFVTPKPKPKVIPDEPVEPKITPPGEEDHDNGNGNGNGDGNVPLSARVIYDPWDDSATYETVAGATIQNNFSIFIGGEEIKDYIVKTVSEAMEVA